MLTAVRRRVAARIGSHREAGITLGELVVSMTITMILLTVATVFFVQTERSGGKSVLTNQTTADARTTLDSWTSMLRVAGWFDGPAQTDRFEEVTPTKVVFYANLNNLPTSCPTLASDCNATKPLTKVALMLVPNATGSDGRLMEVVFKSDNTTPQRVRQVAFNASRTNGQPIFQPYNSIGGPVDVVNTMGCKQGNTPVAGLCLQAPPTGSGMLDPQLSSAIPAVLSSGLLRGNPAANVDKTLQTIAGITVSFTVSDPSHVASMDFTGAASVYSGFPS